MRIALGPVGAPADVFPMFALGKTLQSRGHHVILCAPEEYRSRAYQLGFQMVSCGSSYEAYLEGDEHLKDPSGELAERLSLDMALHFVSLRDALREADVLIGSMLQFAGPSIAEQFGAVYFYSVTSPYLLDPDQHPHPAVPLKKNKPAKRKKVWDRFVLKALNRERQFSGLSPVQDLYKYLMHSGPVLAALDSEMAPIAKINSQTVTGFWLYDHPEAVEENVDLSSSGRFVYFDYFHVDPSKARSFVESLCNAMLHNGLRPLLGSRWSFLQESELPEGCHIIESPSYSTFFPHLAAIVHNGNSELVAQAGRFGVPQILIPRMMDQLDWAKRIFKAGIGPAPLLSPTAEALVKVIRSTIADDQIKKHCREWSNRIESLDALAAAADAIERMAVEIKPELSIS